MNLTIQVLQDNGLNVALTALTVDAGGISINGDLNLTSVSSFTAVVSNNESAEILITVPGYRNYSMVIDNVYSEDRVIDIIMIPTVTDTSLLDYNRPRSFFFSFNDPCNFSVDFYVASNFVGNPSWFINNEFYGNGTKGTTAFCNPGEYQIKLRAQTYTYTTGPCPERLLLWDRFYATTEEGNVIPQQVLELENSLALDTVTNTTILEYRPDIMLELSSPIEQLTNACCYTKGESITITPSVTLNRAGALPSAYLVTYSTMNPEGLIDTVFTGTVDDLEPYILSLDELGSHQFLITVTDTECGSVFSQTINIESCNFIAFECKNCNTFEIFNKSSDTDISVTIADINGEDVPLTNQLIEAQSSFEITFNNTSLFTVTSTYTRNGEEVVEIYVLNNYCGLEDCLSSFILDILCENENDSKCGSEIELNQILLLSYGYFMKLNAEYGYNNFYSALEDSKLAELTTIKQSMDRLLMFCKRRKCTGDAFSQTFNVPPGSGCNTCN